MSLYRNLISQDTSCAPEDVAPIESVMRDKYGTLDGLKPAQFKRAARDAHQYVLVLREAASDPTTYASKLGWTEEELAAVLVETFEHSALYD